MNWGALLGGQPVTATSPEDQSDIWQMHVGAQQLQREQEMFPLEQQHKQALINAIMGQTLRQEQMLPYEQRYKGALTEQANAMAARYGRGEPPIMSRAINPDTGKEEVLAYYWDDVGNKFEWLGEAPTNFRPARVKEMEDEETGQKYLASEGAYGRGIYDTRASKNYGVARNVKFERMKTGQDYIHKRVVQKATVETPAPGYRGAMGQKDKSIDPIKAMVETQKAINDMKSAGFITGNEPWVHEPVREINQLMRRGEELTEEVLSKIFGVSPKPKAAQPISQPPAQAQPNQAPTTKPTAPAMSEAEKTKEEYKSLGGVPFGDYEGKEVWRFPDGNLRFLE